MPLLRCEMGVDLCYRSKDRAPRDRYHGGPQAAPMCNIITIFVQVVEDSIVHNSIVVSIIAWAVSGCLPSLSVPRFNPATN